MTETTNSPPVDKLRSGLIKVDVWENEREFNGKKTNVKSYSITKSWQDKENNWKDQKVNFNTGELLRLYHLVGKAIGKHVVNGGE